VKARRPLLATLVAAITLSASAVASADDFVAELTTDTTVSAYGGAVAWSEYDAPTKRFRLMIRKGDITERANVTSSVDRFDVSLGPDQKGRTVALYTRCKRPARGCDIYRYDLGTLRESRLGHVSSKLDEAWPAQWRNRITFARRYREYVRSATDHRPDPKRRRGPLVDCDYPFVKTLTSRAPARRLDRSGCGTTFGMAIRNSTIVHVAAVSQGNARSESQVRRLRAGGGAARVLAKSVDIGDGYRPFTAPSLSATDVFLTRSGLRQNDQPSFLRIDLASRRATTAAAHVALGNIARDERGSFWYTQGPGPDASGGSPCHFALDPCRLVRASASPFSAVERALLPSVRVTAPPSRDLTVGALARYTVIGDVGRSVLRGGTLVRRDPLPGTRLRLLRINDVLLPPPTADVVFEGASDAAGGWAFTTASMQSSLLMVDAPDLKVATQAISVTIP
jgi:hypothetical protein